MHDLFRWQLFLRMNNMIERDTGGKKDEFKSS